MKGGGLREDWEELSGISGYEKRTKLKQVYRQV